jgi:hypothetical protein
MILQLCRNGASKRVLQDRIGLSDREIDEYLDLLISKNLINIGPVSKGKEKDTKGITPTRRGVRFLDLYDAIRIKYLTASHKKTQ